MTYQFVKDAHKYLWGEYAPASDMTGGYVEGDYFIVLMYKPTKANAKEMMVGQIERWFHMGFEDIDRNNKGFHEDSRVSEIAEAFDCEDYLSDLRIRWA